MFQAFTSVQENPYIILGAYFVILVLCVVNAFLKNSTLTSLVIGAVLVFYSVSLDVSRAFNIVSQSYTLSQKVAELKSENQKLRELNDQLISLVKNEREEAALLVSEVKEFSEEMKVKGVQHAKDNAEVKKVLDEAYVVLKNCKIGN